MNICELAKIIPRKELIDFFYKNEYANAEMDLTFLGFEDIYITAKKRIIQNNFTIIDLGCGYALQSYLFKNYNHYIGVDLAKNIKPLEQENTTYYWGTSIQKFINNILPTLNLDINKVFAICSYVPDDKARSLVNKTFKNYLTYYPDDILKPTIKLKKGKFMNV